GGPHLLDMVDNARASKLWAGSLIVFKDSMIVLGGTSETMIVTQQMIAFNFEDQEWIDVKVIG
ncbi:MAG: hypothetical protein ACKO96_34660, partial [Flammeovirgaceae bacterium]